MVAAWATGIASISQPTTREAMQSAIGAQTSGVTPRSQRPHHQGPAPRHPRAAPGPRSPASAPTAGSVIPSPRTGCGCRSPTCGASAPARPRSSAPTSASSSPAPKRPTPQLEEPWTHQALLAASQVGCRRAPTPVTTSTAAASPATWPAPASDTTSMASTGSASARAQRHLPVHRGRYLGRLLRTG